MVMQPNFDKDNAAKAIGSGSTIFAGVPAMFNALANHPDVQSGKIKLDALKYCVSGGAAMPYEIKTNFEKYAPCSVTEGYGLSEDDVSAEFLKPDQAADRMRDGAMDAFFFVGGGSSIARLRW